MTSGILEGKVAIITGAGRGIGRAHALELASQGAAVVVNDAGVSVSGDRGSVVPAQGVVDEIRERGGSAVAASGSVTSPDDCAETVELALREFGHLDIVVNNAGILRNAPLIDTSPEDFDAVVSVHLRGTFLMVREAARHWSAHPGTGRRIINTTSSTGMLGEPGQSGYSAAKAGILGLTMTAAKELGEYGATCNAISPVAITRMTEQFASAWGGVSEDAFTPFDPRNASPVVAYLASDAAGWLNGQVLRVEGNSVIRMSGWSRGSRWDGRAGEFLTTSELASAVPQLYGTFPAPMLSDPGNR
ncbi:SDR family NAD(P)-dependent oxidoreductase [Microbacterium sp. NPDC077644]|uniref:SDR family NAD(P)-dependent oxidoreductase n=1 Tax=Microbacterium sp. NPDC077644 TaxID=3155055 RepID=UPI00344FD841